MLRLTRLLRGCGLSQNHRPPPPGEMADFLDWFPCASLELKPESIPTLNPKPFVLKAACVGREELRNERWPWERGTGQRVAGGRDSSSLWLETGVPLVWKRQNIWPWGITDGDPILGWMNIHLPPILMFTRYRVMTHSHNIVPNDFWVCIVLSHAFTSEWWQISGAHPMNIRFQRWGITLICPEIMATSKGRYTSLTNKSWSKLVCVVGRLCCVLVVCWRWLLGSLVFAPRCHDCLTC